ncbi:MAG: SulP family inorganic anion transporter [Aestuariivirga sp.]
MTTAAAGTEGTLDGVKSVLRGIWAAFLTAVLTVSFVISFTTIIYGGSLAPLLETGLGLSLLGAALMCAVGGFFYSFRGTICHPQDVTAIVLAVSASAMAENWPVDQGDSLMATIAMLIAVTTAFSGLVAWGFGVLRLGFLARFIPYPVIGGFLAATGYLLLTGAIGLGLGARVTVWTLAPLLEPVKLVQWLPWVLIGGGIAIAARRIRSDLLLPVVLALALASFYAILFASGMDLQGAEDAGLLLGPFDTGGFVQVLTPSLVFDADPWAILRAAPTIMVVALLTILGTLLNATGLELALTRDLDLEKDLRATGIANIAGALGGGMPGYQMIPHTLLGQRMGLRSVLPGLSAAAGCLLIFIYGATLLSALPAGLFVAVISYLGIDLLITWLWVRRRQFSLTDYALVLLILAVAATIGFFEALGIGIMAAAAMFIVSFARVNVVRLRSTLASRRSLVERGEAEVSYLMQTGHQATVIELSGFLFFGTANSLVERVQAELSRQNELRFVVIDFARVHGLDASAAYSLGKLSRLCNAAGIRVIFSGLPRHQEARYREFAGAADRALFTDTLDEALQSLEAEFLSTRPEAAPDAASGLLNDLLALSERPQFADKFRRVTLNTGEVLLNQGAESREMFVLISGSMRAEVARQAGDPVVVARFMPGAPIGEIAFYGSTARIATVLAEEPSVLVKIDADSLVRSGDDHDPATVVHHYLAVTLARRLMNMTRLMRDADF